MKEKLTALLKENFSEIDFTESDALVDDGILESMTLVEIIATIVHAGPGKDGKYRSRLSDKQIEVYLRAARKPKALLLLKAVCLSGLSATAGIIYCSRWRSKRTAFCPPTPIKSRDQFGPGRET